VILAEPPLESSEDTAGDALQAFIAEPQVAPPSGAADPVDKAAGTQAGTSINLAAQPALAAAADEVAGAVPAVAAPLGVPAPALAPVSVPALNSATPVVVDNLPQSAVAAAPEAQPGLDSEALLAAGGQHAADAVDSADLAQSRLSAVASQSAAPAQNTLRPLGGEATMPRSETISLPVGHAGWGDELAGKVNLLVRNGVSEARLQLNPAGLGHVAIDIQTDGDKAVVTFHAQQGATREAIEQAMPRLREMFEQSGLQLTQGSVSDQSQSGQPGGGQAGDPLAVSRAQGAEDQETALAETPGYLPAAAMASALVDYYA